MDEARKLYATLMLSAHCLAEQGYQADRLIEIARHVEKQTGINADSVINKIQKAIDFHNNLAKQERESEKQREKEMRQHVRSEQRFNKLPATVQQLMIAENNKSYRQAVNKLAEKGSRYAEAVTKKITRKGGIYVQPKN